MLIPLYINIFYIYMTLVTNKSWLVTLYLLLLLFLFNNADFCSASIKYTTYKCKIECIE